MLVVKSKKLLKSQALVDGQWVDATNGERFEVRNPFDGSRVGSVPSLQQAQIEQAIAASCLSQKSWTQKTAGERSDLLQAWANLIDEHAEDIAAIMTAEQGKPLSESLGEVTYANSFIRWFAEEGKRLNGDVLPTMVPALRYVVLKQPIGVCAAITPWNFPAAMITRKVAPALASGCTMMVKPAEDTPLTALAMAELANQAGIPKGVLQVLTGDSKMIGQVFCASDDVRKLSFTGSTQVGRILLSQCAGTVKKVSMELGGNAPFIVFADADIDKAVAGLMASKYRNAGQTCVCANRIFIQESIYAEFLAKFLAKVVTLKTGNGAHQGVDIGPLINAKALHKITALFDDALAKGATCEIGGKISEQGELLYLPTVLTQIESHMDIANEEIFGPIAAIQTFATEQEVIKRANDSVFGLAAYFYTDDLKRAWRVTEALEYGMVGHNTGLLSTAIAPFGGVKQSGIGREGSKYGIDEYVEMKYWCSDIA